MMTCAQQWICRSRRVDIYIISIYMLVRENWTKTSLSSCSTDCLVDTILCGCGIVSFLCELSRGLLVYPVICDDGIWLYRVHPPERALGLQKYISSLQAALIKVAVTVCCVSTTSKLLWTGPHRSCGVVHKRVLMLRGEDVWLFIQICTDGGFFACLEVSGLQVPCKLGKSTVCVRQGPEVRFSSVV